MFMLCFKLVLHGLGCTVIFLLSTSYKFILCNFSRLVLRLCLTSDYSVCLFLIFYIHNFLQFCLLSKLYYIHILFTLSQMFSLVEFLPITCQVSASFDDTHPNPFSSQVPFWYSYATLLLYRIFQSILEAACIPWQFGDDSLSFHMFCLLRTAHSVPVEGTYKDITEVLEGLYGDHQLAAAYRSKLTGKFVQEFAATIVRMAHRAFVGLPCTSSRGGGLCTWLDKRLGGEVPPLHGWWDNAKQGPQQGLRLQRWQPGPQPCLAGKGWGALWTSVARDQVQQDWEIHMLAVWWHCPPQNRLLTQISTQTYVRECRPRPKKWVWHSSNYNLNSMSSHYFMTVWLGWHIDEVLCNKRHLN
jgi:hypothetical protein